MEELTNLSLGMEILQGLNSGVPLMQGKEKGDIKTILDDGLTLTDFDFMSSKDGDFAVFTVRECEDVFYYGGSIITDSLKQAKEKLQPELLAVMLEKGIPIRLEKRTSKGNREYTALTFFPSK